MIRRTFFLFLIFLFTVSCNRSEPDVVDQDLSLPEKIDRLIQMNDYETALSLLEDENPEDEEIQLLLEKTHLNYGLHSMSTFDQTEMRTRMNNALSQFTEVLKINPQNEVAQNNIEQILAVYKTIPDRDPEPDVLEGLREVGYNY